MNFRCLFITVFFLSLFAIPGLQSLLEQGTKNSDSRICNLPEDILECIYSFLSVRDQIRLHSVSIAFWRSYLKLISRYTPKAIIIDHSKSFAFFVKIRPILRKYAGFSIDSNLANIIFDEAFVLATANFDPADILNILETFLRCSMMDEFDLFRQFISHFRNEAGASALHLAAELNLHWFIQRVAIELRLLCINASDSIGMAPLHYAVNTGNVVAVKTLLLDRRINVNARVNELIGPFHQAIRDNNPELVEIFLRDPRVWVNCYNGYGIIPIHYAIHNDLPDMVRLLCSSMRVDVNVQSDQYPEHFCPLNYAARLGRESVFKALLECTRVDTAAFDNLGRTVLHTAVMARSIPIIKIILNPTEYPMIADRSYFLNSLDLHGNSALHHAVFSRNSDIVKLLAEEPLINLSLKNWSGHSALDLAKCRAYTNMKALLKQYARKRLLDQIRSMIFKRRSNKIMASS